MGEQGVVAQMWPSKQVAMGCREVELSVGTMTVKAAPQKPRVAGTGGSPGLAQRAGSGFTRRKGGARRPRSRYRQRPPTHAGWPHGRRSPARQGVVDRARGGQAR